MSEAKANHSNILIREAVAADTEEIVSLLYESFVEYRSLYTGGGFSATAISQSEVVARMTEGPLLVALVDGVIAGTVAIVAKGDSLYLRGMAVAPSARGRHIGDRLLTWIEEFALRNGFQRLFLSTTPFLERAIRLYERFGFRRIDGEPEDLFGTPLFTMEKVIVRRRH